MRGFWAQVQSARVVLSAVSMAAAGHVSAQLIPGYPGTVEGFDPREVAMLPSYCVYTDTFRDRIPEGKNPQMVRQWRAQLGPTFEAMHHYCYGLMKTNRAMILSRDANTRRFYLQDSITEFDYVISRAPSDFILLPEILAKKGENLVRLGKGAVGVLVLEQAVELSPAYWPPYAYLSDFYKSTGDTRAAREWLDKGLAHAPDANALLRRIRELDRPAVGSKVNK